MIFLRHGLPLLIAVSLVRHAFGEGTADTPSIASAGATVTAVTTVVASSATPVGAETAELLRQRELLVLENQVREETLRKELASSQAELQRLKTEADLARARTEREFSEKRAEIEKTRLAAEEINVGLALETAKRQAEFDRTLVGLRAERDRTQMQAELATAEFTRRNNIQRTAEVHLAELRAHVAQREQEHEVDTYAEQRPVYLKDPLQADGVLVLSDRRIPLSGPITMETADEISERIDYFNNKNKEHPIFIVIDTSPGGSVMAGYRILKSMQSSTAPVYVLVKSFAASMAAAICTLADRSFAYPNAIIVHHQITSGLIGNLTVQREGLKNLEQWWERLAKPIAAKMGITTDEFIKGMYANTATGDWKEFADNAVKLKWVDAVVGRCQDTALTRNPDNVRRSSGGVIAAGGGSANLTEEKGSTSGMTGQVLPRLNPVDCYYLYNPDGYFRME